MIKADDLFERINDEYKETITEKQLADGMLAVNDALNAAEEDDTPYPVVADGKINVIGDPNKTEIPKCSTRISFRFPKGMIKPEAADASGETWDVKRMEFKDVEIPPRRDLQVLNAAVQVLPYFRKVIEDGTVEKMSSEEIMAIAATMGDEAIDSMYMLVLRVLDIDDDLAAFITPVSALRATVDILKAFPNIANEADGFFE